MLKPETFSPLHILCLLAKYEDLYAFSYNPKQNESEQVKGWQLIDLAEEYKRMGVPNDYWQLSDANRDYKVSVVMGACSALHLFLVRPIENSLLPNHLACYVSKNLQVERVNSLISVQSHNFLIEGFPKALLRERVCMDAWVLWDCFERCFPVGSPAPLILVLCSFVMSLSTEQDATSAFCSADCGGVADSEIIFHLTL